MQFNKLIIQSLKKPIKAITNQPTRNLLRRKIIPNTIWPYMNYLVNDKYKYVYCWIPKVGCTSLKKWFLSTPDKINDSYRPATLHIYVLEKYGLSNYGLIKSHYALKRYHLLAVVRNPWRRLASAFMDKFIREDINIQNIRVIEDIYREKGRQITHDSHYSWKSMGGEWKLEIDSSIPYKNGISFRQFVNYVCNTLDEDLDVHWKPQFKFLGDLSFDTILKLEEIEEKIVEFEKALGIPESHLEHLHRKQGIGISDAENLSEVPSGELRCIYRDITASQLYAPDLIKAIGDRFSKDAEMFGYSYPD